MCNCGKRFHGEAAKFRFLNELIKLLSPKHRGSWTPQRVKDRVTEVLYGWTLWHKDDDKIQEAYRMLKKQGIVKKDPKLPTPVIMTPPPQRTTQSVFDQEDKAKQLAKLLKSTHPEDLETANRLIKSTIREEQEKADKVAKRESTLKEVESSTKQLRELLDRKSVSGTSVDLSDEGKTLFQHCDRLRPTLFRLASDTMDDDAALARVLAVNDELTLTVNAYKDRVGRRERSRSGEKMEDKNTVPKSPREIKSYHLIDLSALDSPPSSSSSSSPMFSSVLEGDQDFNDSGVVTEVENLVSKRTQNTSRSYSEDLLQLNGLDWTENAEQNGGRDFVLRGRGCGGSGTTSNGTDSWPQNHLFAAMGSPSKSQKHVSQVLKPPGNLEHSSNLPQSLNAIFVPMETIKPSHLEPVTLFDQGGVRISLHFAKDPPPGHPGVAVVVISTVNTSALPVRDFMFQAAVPKSMHVKLQPASATHLPPYNPLLPPPAISQVVLLANPQRKKLRLRCRLALTHGDQRLNETREMDDLPDWIRLTDLESGAQEGK
ncbi:ADP-ribosylation factor-binding protein GGA1-like [Antennarius striatus]|uniref:ADP-ribosylation factor-binding protein GGA1-like n=1 Tax=Antennarius striatus TaxID=241820 RepID=UPI0035B4F7E8